MISVAGLCLLAIGCGSGLTFEMEPDTAPESAPWVFSEPELVTTLQDPRLREMSGLVASRRHPGTFYTHNDSGDQPRLFRFRLADGKLDEFRVEGAKIVDWEDLAVLTKGDQTWLYIGDIGDNGKNRPEVVIYRVPEPSSETAGNVRPDRTWRLRYPDGPHNAEALLVEPETEDIFLITKATKHPSRVYRYPSDGEDRGEWEFLGELKVGGPIRESQRITGAAVSPDGKKVALRTYMEALEFDASGNFSEWFRRSPRPLTVPPQIQPESISYSFDGKSIFFGTELSPTPLYQLRLRQ